MKAMGTSTGNCRRSCYDWQAFLQERMSSAQAPILYAFNLVIFLCLSALYESWPIPISILLALPARVIGELSPPALEACPTTCISR